MGIQFTCVSRTAGKVRKQSGIKGMSDHSLIRIAKGEVSHEIITSDKAKAELKIRLKRGRHIRGVGLRPKFLPYPERYVRH